METTHLKKIKVSGYKSIEKLDLNLGHINLLIGANGSGKSNFISLFTFLNHLSQGRLQNYVEKNGGADTFFHFGNKQTKSIEIDIYVSENEYHVKFSHSSHDDTLIFDAEYCLYSKSDRLFHIKGSRGESGLFHAVEADSEPVREYTKEYLNDCRVYHFHDTSTSADFKNTAMLEDSDYLYPNAGNIAAFLYRLKNDYIENYHEIIANIQAVAPFFQDFYLEPRGDGVDKTILLKWWHKNHDSPFSANQLSDGTARFICLATLFLQPSELRPSTIILDEPELGLHPAALDILADIIHTTAKESQIICSTQSIALANHFELKNFIIVDQEDKGVSTFKRLNKNDFEHWLEEYGMGDIWAKNLIGGRPRW